MQTLDLAWTSASSLGWSTGHRAPAGLYTLALGVYAPALGLDGSAAVPGVGLGPTAPPLCRGAVQAKCQGSQWGGHAVGQDTLCQKRLSAPPSEMLTTPETQCLHQRWNAGLVPYKNQAATVSAIIYPATGETHSATYSVASSAIFIRATASLASKNKVKMTGFA
jgi:hypothetical protein